MNSSSLKNLETLQGKLGYYFQDPSLLKLALTHSVAEGEDNEKLEFLGDAALQFASSTLLYNQFSSYSVGELTLARSALVSNAALSAVANELGIDRKFVLGEIPDNAVKDSGKLCADMLEAILGAILLDGGYKALEDFVRTQLLPRLPTGNVSNKHPKTRLQEWCAGLSIELPTYSVSEFKRVANSSQELWQLSCQIEFEGKCLMATGEGRSKRDAERHAAQNMLSVVANLDDFS